MISIKDANDKKEEIPPFNTTHSAGYLVARLAQCPEKESG